MNQFGGLSPEDSEISNIPEITNEKEKKKYVKKQKQKKERFKKCEYQKTREKLSKEIRIIEIEIGEYDNRDKVFTKKEKTKPKVKEFVFDENEIRKFNEKRGRENQEEENKKAKDRKEEQEKSREHWDNWKKRYNAWDNEENSKQRSNRDYKWVRDEDDIKLPFDLKPFIKEYNMELKDVPKDIMSLNHEFSLEDYKKLSRKYHPYKFSGKEDFMYILNGIRYHYVPNEQGNDETWTK